MPDHKRVAMLNVFRGLKQKVIWKWETEEMDDLPPNVKLSKWLPQQDILAHPNLKMFISHGGQSSFQETLCHRKPAVRLSIKSILLIKCVGSDHIFILYLDLCLCCWRPEAQWRRGRAKRMGNQPALQCPEWRLSQGCSEQDPDRSKVHSKSTGARHSSLGPDQQANGAHSVVARVPDAKSWQEPLPLACSWFGLVPVLHVGCAGFLSWSSLSCHLPHQEAHLLSVLSKCWTNSQEEKTGIIAEMTRNLNAWLFWNNIYNWTEQIFCV